MRAIAGMARSYRSNRSLAATYINRALSSGRSR